ncbi:chondroitinase-B domain-containing protein [Arenibacter sp. S6351L]|uniref:chondroitinase-B domain-containing protein n=1 Tax=Arenibacter sp. S6351L TaxID=2926407 RepID=UPI001FF6D01F|nr:chondroitinase-B domain-containing protein [Arenibacter sp. S6351L]MCK0134935.1 right-handed parallel beta-helix repeat-containing protein [Arenibacter sp. S6351L]
MNNIYANDKKKVSKAIVFLEYLIVGFIILQIMYACVRPQSTVLVVSNENEFKAAIQKISAGDTLIIKNGVYLDWSVLVPNKGTPDSLITIRPQSEFGVSFSTSKTAAKPIFKLTGSNLIFKGFVFKDISFSKSIVELNGTQNVRFANCQFLNITGEGRERRMFILNGAADNNEIDHCLFKNNDMVQTLTLRVAPHEVPKNTHIHHNIFKNLNLNAGGEGSETLQISQTGSHNDFGEMKLNTLVENNHFENIRGDAETVSNKSNYNIYRHNTFINTNQFVLRAGHYCSVVNNTFSNSNGPAIRIYGSKHRIENNIIKNPSGNGITMCYGMGSGIYAKTLRITTTDCVVKNNTIENTGGYGIFLGEGKGTDYSNHLKRALWNTSAIQNIPASGNTISSNRIINSTGKPIELAGAINNIIKYNRYKE